jgi:DNA helicase-2/ATP-dependent DNA helicase PcrA
MSDLLDDLNPAQREAVTHLEGPLLVLAGPGSGKTRVITRRIAYLLESGVRPYQILAITFTNKAAGEMRRRVQALVPGSRVLIATFHSFGVRMIRRYGERFGLERNFTIYDQTDRLKVIKTALESADIDATHYSAERIQAAISHAKNQLLGPEAYAAKAVDFFGRSVAHIYPLYQKLLRDANALDFDDLLYWPALALRHDPELRGELDARFEHVLVDEYQDTNLAQYAIARALSIDHPNLFVVGDPDQSVYGWRGSDVRNILNFERDFPGTRIVTLEQNYRSSQRILEAAGHLIAHNSRRKRKLLRTENSLGSRVTVLTYETGLEEAHGIARRIREAVSSGSRRYGDFAVFIRVNALSRALEVSFAREGVPYQMVKAFAFFERKENRDIMAYLRLLVNPRDDVSFLRAVNEPPRGIGKVSLEHLAAHAQARGMSFLAAAAETEHIPALKAKAAKALKSFAELMKQLSLRIDHPPEDVIEAVLDETGYRRMLQESKDPEDQERLANVEELKTAAKQYQDEEGERTIAGFLENITLASDVDNWDETQDWVSIMTLHTAKGLEFPVVYMAAVEHGLLPHDRSQENPEELEEERRLAFVGMTRAKEELFLSRARVREFRGLANHTIESQFLAELPEDILEWVDVPAEHPIEAPASAQWRSGSKAASWGWVEAGVMPATVDTVQHLVASASSGNGQHFMEGMLVRHDVYGQGRVTEVSGMGVMRKIKVRFGAHGLRTFLADKAKLEIVSNP